MGALGEHAPVQCVWGDDGAPGLAGGYAFASGRQP